MIIPLSSYGNHLETNFSRSVSYSFVDQHGKDISIDTIVNQSIEIIIPRDPSLISPQFIDQHVQSINQSFHWQFLSIQSSHSLHFDLRPLNVNLSYLFVYQFDQQQQINFNHFDGFTCLCSTSKSHLFPWKFIVIHKRTRKY